MKPNKRLEEKERKMNAKSLQPSLLMKGTSLSDVEAIYKEYASDGRLCIVSDLDGTFMRARRPATAQGRWRWKRMWLLGRQTKWS